MYLRNVLVILNVISYSKSVILHHKSEFDNKTCGSENVCIKKCCPESHVFQNKVCTFNAFYNFSLDVFETTKNVTDESLVINVIHDKISNCNGMRLQLKASKKDTFFIQKNGSMFKPHDNRFRWIHMENFCLETFVFPTGEEFSALVCYRVERLRIIDDAENHNIIGMIISMPFLFCTFLVYAILPESNIHRKALMCYVLSLLIGYGCLVFIQLNTQFIASFWCHSLGYSITFFFISSFFWMNVMCVDMWLAFSGLRGFKGKKSTERKRFLAYFAYALGMPLLLVIIIFLLNTYADEKSIFNPKLGETRCFLEEGYPNLFYFYLPMAIIIGINIILFILTAVRIQRVKKETSMLKHSDSKRHSYEEEKQQFNLYLRLLFAMGINWSMEVISWAVGWRLKSVPNYIWYLTDFTNAAYGVFIFLIFVFKRKIRISLLKRYYNFINKPHLAHTLSTSHPARTSNYSTTDTAVSHDYRLSEMKNVRGEERPLSRN